MIQGKTSERDHFLDEAQFIIQGLSSMSAT